MRSANGLSLRYESQESLAQRSPKGSCRADSDSSYFRMVKPTRQRRSSEGEIPGEGRGATNLVATSASSCHCRKDDSTKRSPPSRGGVRPMQIQILPDAATVAQCGAKLIIELAQQAIGGRGRFVMAVSGGHTPW